MADVWCTVYTKDDKFELTISQWWSFNKNKLHNENDKPAVIHNDGSKEWYKNGKRHREDDKPAIIFRHGTKAWFKNGKKHRIDGSAVIYRYGDKQWWIDDEEYSEQQYNKIIKEAFSQCKSMGLTDNRWWVRDYYEKLYG